MLLKIQGLISSVFSLSFPFAIFRTKVEPQRGKQGFYFFQTACQVFSCTCIQQQQTLCKQECVCDLCWKGLPSIYSAACIFELERFPTSDNFFWTIPPFIFLQKLHDPFPDEISSIFDLSYVLHCTPTCMLRCARSAQRLVLKWEATRRNRTICAKKQLASLPSFAWPKLTLNGTLMLQGNRVFSELFATPDKAESWVLGQPERFCGMFTAHTCINNSLQRSMVRKQATVSTRG